jgi:DNA-directed RNA polymerase specialized sigma24 family protein
VIHRIPDPAVAPEAQVLAAERCTAVRRAVTALSHRDRRFLGLLYHAREPSYMEISRALDMPIGSIGPTRGRVLERIRRREELAALLAIT